MGREESKSPTDSERQVLTRVLRTIEDYCLDHDQITRLLKTVAAFHGDGRSVAWYGPEDASDADGLVTGQDKLEALRAAFDTERQRINSTEPELVGASVRKIRDDVIPGPTVASATAGAQRAARASGVDLTDASREATRKAFADADQRVDDMHEKDQRGSMFGGGGIPARGEHAEAPIANGPRDLPAPEDMHGACDGDGGSDYGP